MEYRLLGNSVQIKELNETIKQVAPSNISILITGESGTGKEVIANAIHQYSKRKSYPLIKVNCGAIPEGIIESELFGHQKGAFTGAIETRKGYFEMADNGTIFLDEIGEMPLSTQVKILRVLETGEFIRVGGDQNIYVDSRVIAATNRDLAKEVQNKNFRDDLYYRLKSVNLHIPPLRERKSDIPLLFDMFVNNFCRDNNIKFSGIDDEAMDYIINYVWYGNARELKNFTESIIVLNPENKITLADVKKHLENETFESRSLPIVALPKQESPHEKDFIMRALFELKTDILDLKRLLTDINMEKKFPGYNTNEDFFLPKEVIKTMNFEEIEKEIITYFLKNNKWNINKTAEMLEVTPRTIYRKIKLYDIQKD
ncbi:MAG: sigma-54-dependent Fis family transcriptional regulator [Ignavibacteria bacterium]|nr:sigma-54-dependent Fis family transcriptional regulator [Ignavibacteria bacterium]